MHQKMLKRLNGRIAIVVAIVAAELWVLETSLHAWAHGESLVWILAFQTAGFVACLGTLISTPRHRLVVRKVVPLRTPQAAAAE